MQNNIVEVTRNILNICNDIKAVIKTNILEIHVPTKE
jgi:hypothetical protein